MGETWGSNNGRGGRTKEQKEWDRHPPHARSRTNFSAVVAPILPHAALLCAALLCALRRAAARRAAVRRAAARRAVARRAAVRRAVARRAAVRRAAVDLLDAWLRHHSKSTLLAERR